MSRVLVIEDDAAIRNVLSECLEFEAYEVRAVSVLDEGLELLQHESFDLVLTDLPHGPFSTAALQALEPLTEAASLVPVVLSTAHTEARDYDPARYGLAAILIKPFELDALLLCIGNAVAANRAQLRSLQTASGEAQSRLRSAHEQAGKSLDLLRKLRGPDEEPPNTSP
jgi:DNA-binding NtrC family response regulator